MSTIEATGTCILTDGNIGIEDDCTTHDHETTEPVTVYLWGFTHGEGFANRPDWGDTPERTAAEAASNKHAVLAALFGHMVERAEGVIKCYRGDLFRDAQMLNEHIDGPCTFWWGPREFGTHIAFDAEWLASLAKLNPGSLWYRVDLVHNDGPWHATFTVVDPLAVS